MVVSTHLNVYKGPSSMKDYFNPDLQPPLPLVELPDVLNPFRKDNVRIYAKMMTALPAQNVKALPAINMLEKGFDPARKTIVECSSGSTVISLSLASRALYQNSDVHAYISNKIDISRLRMLQFFGLKLHLYGGPQQPEISDRSGTIYKLRRQAEQSESMFNPAQYENRENPASHLRWTGPQLMQQIPEIDLFCAGMGSAGCITGTGLYLKGQKPDTTVLGVCNPSGDSIPGPRPYSLLDTNSFPWKTVLDAVEEVESADSYRLSMRLSQEGLICGPSSGMALEGLLRYLGKLKKRGLLPSSDGSKTEFSCVFVCCDLPYQYLDGYFQKLDDSDFHPILNPKLLSIDTDRYDPRWELEFVDARKMLFGWKQSQTRSFTCSSLGCSGAEYEESTTVIDFRSHRDFRNGHLPGSINLPLRSLHPSSESPFDDDDILESQWNELKDLFCNIFPLDPKHGAIVVLCYNGETSRLAASVMRAQNLQAFSIKGGMADIYKKTSQS